MSLLMLSLFVCVVFTQSWTEALGPAQCQLHVCRIERPKQGTLLCLAGDLSASSTEKVHKIVTCFFTLQSALHSFSV